MKRFASIACLTIILSGCAWFGTGTTKPSAMAGSPGYAAAEVPAFMRGKEVFVNVHGNPFTDPKPQVHQAVVSALNSAYTAHQTTFTTNPTRNMLGNYRIVIALNPIGDIDDGSLCTKQYIPTAEYRFDRSYSNSSDRRLATMASLQAKAALCRGATLISSASEFNPRVGYSTSPAFKELVVSLVNTLLMSAPADIGKFTGDGYYQPDWADGTPQRQSVSPERYYRQ